MIRVDRKIIFGLIPFMVGTLYGIALASSYFLSEPEDTRAVFVYVTASPTPANLETPAVTTEAPTPTIEALPTAAPSAGVEASILAPTPVFAPTTPTPTPEVVAPLAPVAQPTPAPTCVHIGQGIGQQRGVCRRQGF